MKECEIISPGFSLNRTNGSLKGQDIVITDRYIKDLNLFFEDEEARATMPQDQLLYQVQAIFPVVEGTEGGLLFGRTTIQPGKVGDEYFMTKGHFHKKSNRGEYYWGLQGEGMLILMDRRRRTWAEKMYPGSLHYIPGHVAHRTANTSDMELIFGACWPSDAGHDYQEIIDNGFSACLKEINGKPQLISQTDETL